MMEYAQWHLAVEAVIQTQMRLDLESAIFFLCGNQREVDIVGGSWTRPWKMGWISIGEVGVEKWSWEVESIQVERSCSHQDLEAENYKTCLMKDLFGKSSRR